MAESNENQNQVKSPHYYVTHPEEAARDLGVDFTGGKEPDNK